MTIQATRLLLLLTSGAIFLAGCERTGAAPPTGAEGAVGTVNVDNAGASENPVTPALPGGPAGQTPDYPEPGGVGSVVHSGSQATPPAKGGASSHAGQPGD